MTHGTFQQPSVFKHHMNRVFVETGSNLGLGIQEALEAGFEKIISIELSEELHNICKERFKDERSVELVYGDSAVELERVIASIEEPITFWLDAHYCGGCPFDGRMIESSKDNPAPLIKELLVIKDHPVKEHVIMIDNYAYFKHQNIMILLWEINPSYTLRLINGTQEHDVILAKL